MKSWRDLQSPEDAMPMIKEWASSSPLDVRVLPVSREDGERTLESLQITTRSPMGALAFHTGGLLVDHGWLRILGAAATNFPARWTVGTTSARRRAALTAC